MAIGTGTFRTPTGRTYDPANSIERSFDKTSGIITNAINEKARYKQEQENAFGQLYANLGELESNLQQNYAGINQQMVDSTREFMKEHYKKGGKSTDPEFQSQVGQMTGRIKAGMSNADRNREMLKQSAELIKADPAITDKARAMAAMYQKMQDPDFLISQNQFNPSEVLDQFVDPRSVFEQAWKSQPSQGEWSNEYTDAAGNIRRTDVITNPLIDKDTPVNPDGTPNVKITPEFIQDVQSGRYGERLIDQTLKIANERYTNLPADLAFSKALKDGITPVAEMNYKNSIAKRKSDIDRENAQLARQNTMTDIAIAREARLAGKEDEADELNNRFQEFSQASTTGNIGFLGEYENQKSGLKDFKWVDAGDKYKAEKELHDKIKTKEGWSNLSRDERVKIIEDLDLGDQIPSALGGIGKWETNSDEAYNAVKSTLDQFMSEIPSGTSAISYKQKTGTKDGNAVYEDVQIPVTNQQEMENAFRTLENLRRSGKGFKPVIKADPPNEIDLTQKDYWN